MWQIFSFLGQQCLTMNLPLRERVAPDWNKGRERGGGWKKKSSAEIRKEEEECHTTTTTEEKYSRGGQYHTI